MKKWIALILAAVLVCAFAGCKEKRTAEHKGGMVGKKSTYDISHTLMIDFKGEDKKTEEIILEIQNPLDVQCAYGYGYVIEVLTDGEWYTTQYGAPDTPAGVYVIEPGEIKEHSYKLFNEPPAGTYRLVLLGVYVGVEKSCVAAEFTLE